MNGFALDPSFRPTRWLRNRHVQSVFASLPVRRRRVERHALPLRSSSEEVLLDCGDGVVLQAFHSSPSRRGRAPGRRLAVLLHGWEGSAESMYLLSLAQTLFERGYEVVRLNLRDHGQTHHLNRELFHSCRLPEVVGAVRAIQDRFADRPMYLAGFSLGGNFMLRVAAAAPSAGIELAHTAAVSPVLDPARTLDALEQGTRLYHAYFVLKWSRSLLHKQAAWPGHYDFAPLIASRDLRRMTEALVRGHTEYPSLGDYLSGYAITGERLARLATPATLITALDDPIIPARDLDRIALPGSLRVVATAHGGHCGFIERPRAPSWVNLAVASAFEGAPDLRPT